MLISYSYDTYEKQIRTVMLFSLQLMDENIIRLVLLLYFDADFNFTNGLTSRGIIFVCTNKNLNHLTNFYS